QCRFPVRMRVKERTRYFAGRWQGAQQRQMLQVIEGEGRARLWVDVRQGMNRGDDVRRILPRDADAAGLFRLAASTRLEQRGPRVRFEIKRAHLSERRGS